MLLEIDESEPVRRSDMFDPGVMYLQYLRLPGDVMLYAGACGRVELEDDKQASVEKKYVPLLDEMSDRFLKNIYRYEHSVHVLLPRTVSGSKSPRLVGVERVYSYHSVTTQQRELMIETMDGRIYFSSLVAEHRANDMLLYESDFDSGD
ncbi:hypothetical protein [Pseudomonas sp. NA-150]|uniref:hypothetical protein n=1 Tax=Pseudomonas sp. NA-150 TaxID=3367525 RepID=UPI0037C60D08